LAAIDIIGYSIIKQGANERLFYGLVLWTGERWHRFNVIKLALNIKSQNLTQKAIDFDKNMLNYCPFWCT